MPYVSLMAHTIDTGRRSELAGVLVSLSFNRNHNKAKNCVFENFQKKKKIYTEAYSPHAESVLLAVALKSKDHISI